MGKLLVKQMLALRDEVVWPHSDDFREWTEQIAAVERLSLKLKCAGEAIKAHGNTERAKEWYRNWLGLDVPTTVQYSLSCALMDEAKKLVEGDALEPKSPQVYIPEPSQADSGPRGIYTAEAPGINDDPMAAEREAYLREKREDEERYFERLRRERP